MSSPEACHGPLERDPHQKLALVHIAVQALVLDAPKHHCPEDAIAGGQGLRPFLCRGSVLQRQRAVAILLRLGSHGPEREGRADTLHHFFSCGRHVGYLDSTEELW
jgi:hypothetical protein